MKLDIDLDRLKEAIDKFSQARVMVLGDVMLDQFLWGSVRRISPEAPVPVVEVESETYMLGGAANVLHNLVALGGTASICGLVGDDQSGRQVVELLEDLEVDASGLIVADDRPTTVKTRVVAHSQQVVRVDREHRKEPSAGELGHMVKYIKNEVKRCDAVIVSDYAKGAVCARTLEQLLTLAKQGKKTVAVDPKVANMPLYAGATIVTPNHLEAAAAAGVSTEQRDYVQKAGKKLLKDLGGECVLITQGELGMTLFSGQGRVHIPTAAKRVFDVTGAGDTVISTLTLGMVSGLTPAESAFLANQAAGVVVGEVGTSAVTGGRLAKALDEEGRTLLGKG